MADVDRSRTDPPLAEANRLAAQGETDRALLVLARAESLEPADPRVPYRIGELLSEAGRPDEATVAYRRTLRLDPSRAMVFYKLGMAYKAMGDRHRAVYALEQAVARSGSASALRERAEWQVTQLTFTLLPEVGLADAGARREPSDWYGISEAEFPRGVTEIAWWARVSERFAHLEEKITVRWLDPNGAVVQEGVAEHRDSPYVAATLKLDSQGAERSGEWVVEALYEGDVIDHQRFVVRP